MSGLFGQSSSDDIDSGEDSITTASTVDSDQEPGAVFPVADLLADKYDPELGTNVYLVLWEGYPLHRASWEPPANFNAGELIRDYEQRCAEGKVDKQLHLERYYDALEEAQKLKDERRRRREKKRALRAQKARQQQKLTRKKAKRTSEKFVRDAPRRRSEERLEGFVVADDESLEEESVGLPSSEDEDDFAPRKRKLREKIPRKAPVVSVSSEEESDSGADSMMEDLASKVRKKKGIAKSTQKEGASDTKRTGRKFEKSVPKKRPLKRSPSPVHRKRPTVAEKKGAAIGTTAKNGNITKTIPKTTTAKKGTAATQRTTQTGIQNDPTQVRTYDKLSIRNKVAKRGRQDRAPAAEELNLINLGGSSRAADDLVPGLNELGIDRRESLAKRKRSPSAEPAVRSKPAIGRIGGPRAPVAQAKPAQAPTKQTQAPVKRKQAPENAQPKAPENAQPKAPEKAQAKAPAKVHENAPMKQMQAQARTEQPSEETGPKPGSGPRKLSQANENAPTKHMQAQARTEQPSEETGPKPGSGPRKLSQAQIQAMPEPLLQSPAQDNSMDIIADDTIAPHDSVPAPIVQPSAAPHPRPWPGTHFLPISSSLAPPQAQPQPQPTIPIQSVPETFDAMEIDRPDPSEFSCEVFYGTSMAPSNSLGVIKFDFKFDSAVQFLAMLRDIGLDKMWISKSLENRYIREKFVPKYGPPAAYVDMRIPEHVDLSPFLTTLSVLNGAGVVVHEEFTLFVFQPSNESLRVAFKTPSQKVRSPLRAVLYPPLGVEVPTLPQGPVTSVPMHKPFDEGFDSYLPNLMHRTLGCYGEFLKKRIPPDHRSFCVTFCPEISKPERLELELALRMLGHRIVKIHDIQEIDKTREKMKETMKAKKISGTPKISVTVFVHTSLRLQIHLLPNIKALRRMPGAVFRFFGMQFNRPYNDPRAERLVTVDYRFWKWGTLILMTPKFIIDNIEGAYPHVFEYQKAKQGSTKLCISSGTCERLKQHAIEIVRLDQALAKKIMTAAMQLEDCTSSGVAMVLPVEVTGPVQSNELEPGEIPSAPAGTEIDWIVDRFALYHLENCAEWRRFVVCHSKAEEVEGMKELFQTIDFIHPDAVMREFRCFGGSKQPDPAPQQSLVPTAASR